MWKTAALLLVLALCACADDTDSEKNEGARQKRLLFFDEGGTLVKTYSNPYLNSLSLNADRLPYYGNFMNPFFNFIKVFGNSLAAITIPVSSAIIEQIKKDPTFQNSLAVIPKNPVVEPSPLCDGMRTQVPSPAMCNNFLNCWDGWAVEQECPTGLLFSSNGYCDYADNVDCKNRKLNVDKLQPQPQPVCNKDFETFRNKLNCNEFFVCVNRQPVRFKCPADLKYSQYLGVCDYEDRVDCTSAVGPAIPPFQPAFPNLPDPSPAGPFIIPQPPSSSPVPPLELPSSSSTPPSNIPATNFPPSNFPPSLPNNPPSSFPQPLPNIPPTSILPPGSYIPPGSPDIPSFPIIPPVSDLRPSFVKPLPPASVFPVPIESLPKPADTPGNGLFTPGCQSASVAMSRQDAIRQLQGQIP